MSAVSDAALVARLRSIRKNYDLAGGIHADVDEAANRLEAALPMIDEIEALQADVAEALAARDQYAGLYAERCGMLLEAQCERDAATTKLTKATEALRKIAKRPTDEGGCYYNNRFSVFEARQTLADIEKDASQ